MRNAGEISELKIWSDPPLHIANVKKMVRQAWRRTFGDICQSCGCRMHFEAKFRTHRHFATIDHILARGLGGTNSLDNLQIICRECNNKKSLDEYHAMPADNT